MTREEAKEILQAVKFLLPIEEYSERVEEALDMAIEALERKHGEWKEVYAETDYRNGWIEFTCENCEYQHGLESGEYGWSYGEDIPWRFCPICGADMRGEKDVD